MANYAVSTNGTTSGEFTHRIGAFGTGDFTIEGWLKITTGASSAKFVWSVADVGGYASGYQIIFADWGDGTLRFYNGGWSTGKSYTVGNWYWFCVWKTGGKLYFSLNNDTPLELSDAVNYVRTYMYYGSEVATDFDEVNIWNYALDATARSAAYNSGNGRYNTSTTNLNAGYHMDEGTGSNVADTSTNSRTGTIETSTWAAGKVSGNTVPNAPTISSPSNGATSVSRNPTLSASAFSDPDAGNTHAGSQWEIYTDAGFTTKVWDSGDTATNLTSVVVNTTNGTFSGALNGKTRLASNTTYYWRVRYKDNNGDWSSYGS